MISALAALAIIGNWPASVTAQFAGVNLEKRAPTPIGYYDPETRLFLVTTLDCDGAHRSLTVTRDRRVVRSRVFDTSRFGLPKEYDFAYPIVEKRFKPVTGSGVRIGDSKESVLKRLGNPQKAAVRGDRNQFWCSMYKSVKGTTESGSVLRNTYIFKDGKLVEISINLDGIPGCGGDSLSDEGWPWSEF